MSDTPKGIDPLQDPFRPGYFMNYAENETEAEMVLRKLACWLGVGGYNATKVDADAFHHKIVDGVNSIINGSVNLKTAILARENADLRSTLLQCLEVRRKAGGEHRFPNKFAKIEFEGDWFVCRFEDLGAYLIDFLNDEGTSYTVSKVEMTEEEFKALPDFNGF